MNNIMMIIEFVGTDYSGWQRQSNARSVQGEIENCIMVVTKERVTLHSSGRTDAGVHARKMTANFLIERDIDIVRLRNSLNSLLPDDIAVVDMRRVDDGFHARISAKKKVYEYHIFNRDTKDPFMKKYSWYVRKPLDVSKMRRAAKRLTGEHDFTGFTSTGTSVKSFLRTIYDIDIQKNGHDITLTFTGSGFLKQMVRNITGLLVQIGYGKYDEGFADVVLRQKKIEKPYITAPARGLFLIDVIY